MEAVPVANGAGAYLGPDIALLRSAIISAGILHWSKRGLTLYIVYIMQIHRNKVGLDRLEQGMRGYKGTG